MSSHLSQRKGTLAKETLLAMLLVIFYISQEDINLNWANINSPTAQTPKLISIARPILHNLQLGTRVILTQ